LADLRLRPRQRVVGRRSSRAILCSTMRFMRALSSRYARSFVSVRQTQPWLVRFGAGHYLCALLQR
jgi:hypothetical protein